MPPWEKYQQAAPAAEPWKRYAAPQAFAAELRAAGSDGIVYPSLRNPGGTCLAAFWPDVVSVARQADHYRYHWNGTRIDYVHRITGTRAVYDLTA